MTFKNQIFHKKWQSYAKHFMMLIMWRIANFARCFEFIGPSRGRFRPSDFTLRCPRLCSKWGIYVSGQIFLAQYKGEGESISRTNLVRNGENCKIAWREWQTTKRFYN